MTAGPAKRAKGRPRDPARRAALLDAARELFLRLGADAITIDQVIAGAKVSRATYYSNFSDRRELLAAVIRRESERIVTDDAADAYEAADLRGALTSYGDALMRFLADPDTMRLESLIQHVGQSQPELATSFFVAGPRRVWTVLERIIVNAQARGQLGEVDPARAVSDLIGLWQGCWRTEIMYGQRLVPDEQELRERSRHAVDVFLRAYGKGV